MTKRIFTLLLIFTGIAVINSCTKLKEQILDESSVAGLTDKQQAEGIISPVYAKLEDVFLHTTYFSLQEISTDEAILPFRGGTDWGDNGIYVQVHKHENISSDVNVRNTWNHALIGLSRAVTAINSLPANAYPDAKVFLAEARGMRAYYSMLTLDLFGLIFVKELPEETSKILRGEEAIAYIKSELLAVEPLLDNTTGPGRLTKAGVQGLLVRLYLNAAVYRDVYAPSFTFKTEDMDKVIEYSNKIISSGQYALSADYFSIFNDNNHTNKELIFAVDQRADLGNGHNRMGYFSLSGDHFPLYNQPGANGTDGPGITPEFYRTWVNAYAPVDPAAADPRFYKQNWIIPLDSCFSPKASFNLDRGILRGQQYGLVRLNGAFIPCGTNGLKVGKLFNTTRAGSTSVPVNFTEQIDFTIAGSGYSTGYRVSKYEYSKTSVSGRNFGEHDIVILRLADIYLMRAEAKLRKGDATGALADVNIVRASRTNPPAPLTSMTLDLLFRERGFELYWECVRRSDMIRFGKYEGTWTEKSSTDVKKRLFPIPLTAIDAASNLPGYLVQNPSY